MDGIEAAYRRLRKAAVGGPEAVRRIAVELTPEAAHAMLGTAAWYLDYEWDASAEVVFVVLKSLSADHAR
jgi:hypothetical protein